MSRRRICKVALVGMSPGLAKPEDPDGAWRFPSYGMRRIEASIRADPALADLEVVTFELPMLPAAEVAELLLAEAPDFIGASVYIWSFPTLLEAARLVRRRDPGCAIVFGGPSAEPPMCALPPYADSNRVLDALVLSEGEMSVREILAGRDVDPARLAGIAGLALPASFGWRRTEARPLNEALDELPSPAAMGLLAKGDVAYLETFRGCPMSCSFCEWGVMGAGTYFSREGLVRELEALTRLEPQTTYLLDAALNLNKHAFRNFAAAEDEVRFFAANSLIALLYPALIDDGHTRFLEGVRALYLSVGLQSFDEQVLSGVDRRSKSAQFDRTIRDLAAMSNVRSLSIELILGLPTDTPARFRASLDRALAVGCGIRIYRCLVLPNGLMTRAAEDQLVRFDEHSLMLTSSVGWAPSELVAEQDRLCDLAAKMPGGYSGEYWWYFPPASRRLPFPALDPARANAPGAAATFG
ncbi:MAG: B12-binding domain-containing radical SAM protein [Thermoanaerobaculia bacterium]